MNNTRSNTFTNDIIYGQPIKVEHTILSVYLYAPWPIIERILLSGELKATLPEKCNDLYDTCPCFETSEEQARFVRTWRGNNMAMFCFSLTPNSCAMWGHYADHGKGGVLKFDLPVFKLDDTNNSERDIIWIGDKIAPKKHGDVISLTNLSAQKVYYCDKRPMRDSYSHTFEGYMNFLSTKGKEWEHEKEMRVIVARKDPFSHIYNGDYFSDKLMQYLAGISIGPRANVDFLYVKHFINSLPAEHIAKWPKFDKDSLSAINEADISRTHYSVCSGWFETFDDDFLQIPSNDATWKSDFIPLPTQQQKSV